MGRAIDLVFNRSNRKVTGKRITTFIKAFRAACTKAGCPGRIAHDLRRTAVRNLVRAGVPERIVIQMTGHKTRSAFERCNIVSNAIWSRPRRSSTRFSQSGQLQTVTGLPRRSGAAAKAGTIRA